MKKIILLLALTAILHNMQGQNPSAAKPVKKTVGATSSNINATTTSTLSGIFYAPSGISIVLQNNGKNDLTISPKKESGRTFSITNFTLQIKNPTAEGKANNRRVEFVKS